VWTTTQNFYEFRTRFLGEVKRAFDANGIEFPFPQRTLTFGDAVEVRARAEEPDPEPTSGTAP
jgi:small-conductance mechanosensitive channel